MFTDTLESLVRSKRSNKYGQVYCTHFGWNHAYGIPTKGTAYETLYNLINQDGCPNAIIMNISKDQTLVKLKKKSNDVNIHNSQIEPFSPWPN